MRALGYQGEQIAAEYLAAQGYEILAQNYAWRHGEIDIIARDKKVLAFIEVKYYKINSLRDPREAVDPVKQRHIIRTAEYYLWKHRIIDSYVRFDAVLITYAHRFAPEIRLIKDAFRA